jgi:hypothetical protein
MATAPAYRPPSIEEREQDEPIALTHDEPTAEEIAAEAYAIYIARGANDGRDFDDWLEAERALKTRG